MWWFWFSSLDWNFLCGESPFIPIQTGVVSPLPSVFWRRPSGWGFTQGVCGELGFFTWGKTCLWNGAPRKCTLNSSTHQSPFNFNLQLVARCMQAGLLLRCFGDKISKKRRKNWEKSYVPSYLMIFPKIHKFYFKALRCTFFPSFLFVIDFFFLGLIRLCMSVVSPRPHHSPHWRGPQDKR